jgi:hypothetical protein
MIVECNKLKDYYITPIFAKKLCMQSQSVRGEEARNYFLAMEKKALQPTNTLPTDYISALEALIVSEKSKLELQSVVDHKNKVVLEHIEKVPAKTMRTTINELVRSFSSNNGMQYRFVWHSLYKEFKALHHIDLSIRAKNDKRLSAIDFAEKLGQLENLYYISLKMFELYE